MQEVVQNNEIKGVILTGEGEKTCKTEHVSQKSFLVAVQPFEGASLNY
jgi:hypothetical protein